MPQATEMHGGAVLERRDVLLQQAMALIESASQAGVALRLVGSLGIQYACPVNRDLAVRGRHIKDIDLAARKRDHEKLCSLIAQHGFVESKEIFITSEGRRSIFRNPKEDLDIDLFYGVLEFCHKIEFDHLFDIRKFTIPPTELLLQKLQIIEISPNDQTDIGVLLLEHELDEEGDDGLNLQRLGVLWGKDWGLWRTSLGNLERLGPALREVGRFDEYQLNIIRGQVERLVEHLQQCRKSLSWKMRNRLGDKVKWYNDVEDV